MTNSGQIAKRPAASRLVTLFALLVFAIQGYLVQTHIHKVWAAPLQVSDVSAPTAPVPVDPLDPGTCALCQELVHAGVTLAPALVTLPLQLDWIVYLIPTVLPQPASVERQRSWQSRAPPRR
jgi:hypothetical protein